MSGYARKYTDDARITCVTCGVSKEGRCFGRLGKLTGECRICRDRSNSRKRAIKNGWLRNYGLTPEDYAAMLAQQGGRCAICCEEPKGSGPMQLLYVDHDHKTGKVRGLLCNSCNTAIGLFRDNPERLRSAIRYLKAHGQYQDADDSLQLPLF